MIRNRKSRVDAMIVRAWVAGALAAQSQLDPPLTLKRLQRELLPAHIPIATLKRHRAWVRREYAAGRLQKLAKFIRDARNGRRPEW